jgi:NAD(P)-dependent dehydrogenase (short-subunit alcohol dehydrogenase family)
VTILDLDREGAERVAAEVGGTPLVVDLARPQRLDGLELDADVLVNNVGLQHVAPVEEFPPERFQRMLAVMLEAPFRLARAVLAGMYRPGWARWSTSPRSTGCVPRRTRAPTWPPSSPLGGTLVRSQLIYLLVRLGQEVLAAPPQAALGGLGP